MATDEILQYIGIITGIISVYYSKKENLLVYPVGLVNTIIYVYLSFKYELIGEASVNFYYTVMSIYGWIIWAKKDELKRRPLVPITFSDRKEKKQQFLFFLLMFLLIFLVLTFLKEAFYPGAIPWADGFAAATAFTGMWLMARKKVESWYWWIATNIASIPLYIVKELEETGIYYGILLVMAFFGLRSWQNKARTAKATASTT